MKIRIYFIIAILLSLFPLTTFAGEVHYYHTDNFGTPMAMTDVNGDVVWRSDELPFGEEYETIENPIKNNIGFLGKKVDEETGLINMGSRFLDPKNGRFNRPDPVGLVNPATGKVNQAMLQNPQRQNRYVYGLNNPYRYVDPDGNTPWDVVDAGFFALSVKNFASNPGWGTGAELAADTISLAPLVPSIGWITKADDAANLIKGAKKTIASPALKSNPYSPGEVSRQQSQLRESLGVNLSPDTPIPTQKPGSNIKSGVHTSEGKTRHSSGERNVSSKEEHSRVAKSRGGRRAR